MRRCAGAHRRRSSEARATKSLQSQQLLKIIQSNSISHPDGIIFEPVGGTALPQVAKAAAAAGIAWVVLNRDADYLSDLRRAYTVPIFAVSSDHEEIGRLQGRQLAALLPNGGSALLIQGPSESMAARQRTTGMYETKPVGIQVKLMKGHWTEASAYRRSVPGSSSRLRNRRRSTSLLRKMMPWQWPPERRFRKAVTAPPAPVFWRLPILASTDCPQGLLTATIIVPTNTGLAIDMLARAVQTGTLAPRRLLPCLRRCRS